MEATTHPAVKPHHTLSGDSSHVAYPLDAGLKKLGIGRTKAYELIDDGELETYKVGKRRFIAHAALERFVARREAAEREARMDGSAAA